MKKPFPQSTPLGATPGPWEFTSKLTASENHKGFFIRAEKATRNGKWALAEVQPGDEDGKLGEANARLIAAAPDLLRFAQLVQDDTVLDRQSTDYYKRLINVYKLWADEVIKKARGA